MRLDLSEVLSTVGMRIACPVEEPPLVDEDLECAAPVVGELVFTNTGNALLIGGILTTEVVLSCARCLRYFRQPLEVEIEEQFSLRTRPMGPGARKATVEVEEEEDANTGSLFTGPVMDLTDLLRQSLTLVLPLGPLHDPDCAGLCVRCGADLNEAACGCDTGRDGRALSGLGALLHGGEQEPN
jgi:uncharacterized protein